MWRRPEAGPAASVCLGTCPQPGESAVRSSVGTSLPFISSLPGCPDLHVHAHQRPDAGSDSQLFWGSCPISTSGPSLAPLPASLSLPSLAIMCPHVEKLVCTGAANFACCNGCQLLPTSTRGEPQHPSRRAQQSPSSSIQGQTHKYILGISSKL